MEFIATLAAVVAVVWFGVLVSRMSLCVGGSLFLCVGYVLGHQFFHVDMGPIPLTLDRIFFLVLLAAAIWRWQRGDMQLRPPCGTDWCFIAVVMVFAASTLLVRPDPLATDFASPTWRLIASYIMPLMLYLIVRHTDLSERWIMWTMRIIAALGVYLAVTAIAEITHQWWAVFPSYIADPKLGTHFGRARGPTLMAASMGVHLTLGWLSQWFLLRRSSRQIQLLLIGLLPVMMIATYFTYTRSTWLGMAAAVLVIVLFDLRGMWRGIALVGVTAAGLVVVAVKGDAIVSLERDTSASETRHSVSQRASFSYVSWEMFKVNPVFGCGFGRFYDQKLPYLADRSQQIELESIRGLQHHNTLLSVLTETGLIGFSLFAAMLIAVLRTGWQLVRFTGTSSLERSIGVLLIALTANYLCSALFHDLSLSPYEHSMLFFFAGIAVSLRQGAVDVPAHVAEQARAERNNAVGARQHAAT